MREVVFMNKAKDLYPTALSARSAEAANLAGLGWQISRAYLVGSVALKWGVLGVSLLTLVYISKSEQKCSYLVKPSFSRRFIYKGYITGVRSCPSRDIACICAYAIREHALEQYDT